MNTKEMTQLLKESEQYGYVTLFHEDAFEVIDKLEELKEMKKIITNPHITQDETMKRLLLITKA